MPAEEDIPSLDKEIDAALTGAGHTPVAPGNNGYQIYGHRAADDHIVITHQRDSPTFAGLPRRVSRPTLYAWERDLQAAGFATRLYDQRGEAAMLVVARDETVADRVLAELQTGGAA